MSHRYNILKIQPTEANGVSETAVLTKTQNSLDNIKFEIFVTNFN